MRELLIDLALAALIIGLGSWWGSTYWAQSRDAGRAGSFYQHYFEPAVMVACGRGFVVSRPQFRAMEDFVLQRVDRFSCDDIPAGVELGARGMYQGAWRYLLTSVGIAWRVLGVSWSGLGPLFGLLFGLTLACAYGIVRLAVGRPIALVGVTALALSTLHLMNLPHLRDYAKAPFTLALVLTLGIAVSRPFTWRRAIATGLAAGVVLGIGYGFRTDFLVFLPFVAITFLAFAGPTNWQSVPRRLAATTVCGATFLLLAWPILSTVGRSGGCQWHVALLGLADQFTSELRVLPGPYEVGYAYFDGFAYRQVSSFAARADSRRNPIEYCSPDYDAASGEYLSTIVRTIPADFVTRALAAVVGTVRLPAGWTGPPLDDWFWPVYGARYVVLRGLAFTGAAAVVLAIVIVATRNLRHALFLLFALLYLGGYPAIQYANRHYFHLEFIGWFAYLIVLQAVWKWTVEARRTSGRSAFQALVPNPRLQAQRLAAVAGMVSIVIAGSLLALRWYQQDRLQELFATYIAAPKRRLHPVVSDGSAITRLDGLRWFPEQAPSPALQSALLDIRLDASRCAPDANVTFRYDPAHPDLDFTRTVRVGDPSQPAQSTRIFFPVFENFSGLEFAGLGDGCLDSVSQITSVDKLPLIIAAVLPQGWEHFPLYQRLDP